MNRSRHFSPARLGAMLVKEFTQMRRDKLTFGMMLGIPLLQLILFGFVINSDPKHLPTAVLLADYGPQGRTLLQAIQNSGYFDFVLQVKTEAEAEEALARGDVQFVINIPVNFSRDLLRGLKPAILIEADATDPAATGNALGSLRVLAADALQPDLKGPLTALAGAAGPIDLRLHPRYNPEAITQYHIIPGLMGVVLTMTMIMITGLAITRERERGTMENLLSMPTRPFEVLAGKIIPYILVGLPSMMLSGFMFPFRGMPVWAQYIGEVLPLTHFLRIVRGIMLKGNGFNEVIYDLGAIALFGVVILMIAVKRYRQTLD